MKKILPVIALAGVMVACNNPRPDAKVESAQNTIILDTAGLAQFQAWKAQNEMAQYQQFGEQNNTGAVAPVRRSTSSSRSSSSARRSSGSSGSTASTGTTANQKKGWSKAAKGAVIGGVAGGAAGAIINKRNRVVGGVVGGIIGAGVGYGVGRAQDKKDGRY